MSNNNLIRTIIFVTLYAIAMGYMESAVVIYLRELFYKDGFEFPLRLIPSFIGRIEFLREVATIIMLLGLAYVSGKTKLQRFAYYAYAFAIWDIFYYVFLYVFLGWPQSLSTWDILFLIPVPWVGPVWAPCLISLLMIIGSVFIIVKTSSDNQFRIHPFYWWLLISGAFICIVSFMWDYLSFSGSGNVWSVFSRDHLFSDIQQYVPKKFNYALFLTGFIPMCSALFLLIFNTTKK